MSATRRRLHTASAALILLCALAAPLAWGAAGGADVSSPAVTSGAALPVPPAEAAAQASPSAGTKLTAKDALFVAKSLLEQGQLDEAEKIYAALSAAPDASLRIEALFQLGQIRLRQGKFRQASNLFLDILRQRPDLPRVRLELARAYFLDKNYTDAAFQFELVKGGKLPQEVLDNVDHFLDAIRRQKNWTFDFGLSPVSDSNINQASGGREECINTAFGTFCRPLEEKSSGMGISANAALNYFWRLHQDWGLRATAEFYGTKYEEKDFNDYILAAALGPRYLWESGEASVQPLFRKRWIGDKEYGEDYGLRLDLRQIYKRLLLEAGGSYVVNNYADSYIHSVLKGSTWTAHLQPRFILTGQSFVQAGLAFRREDTKNPIYTNDSWRYAMGAYYAFSYGVSLFVEGSLTQARYKAPQWYVTRDNRIDETVREDKTWGLFAALSSNLLERYNLTPVVQYAYTRRVSNIWTRDYERHRINFLLNYRF